MNSCPVDEVTPEIAGTIILFQRQVLLDDKVINHFQNAILIASQQHHCFFNLRIILLKIFSKFQILLAY